MSNNTGWICPKCEVAIAPSEKTCPACPKKIGDSLQVKLKEIRDNLGKELKEEVAKVQEGAKKLDQQRDGKADAPPLFGDNWPTWNKTWPVLTGTLAANSRPCAFDGLSPGTYNLYCGCPRCSAYSLASPKIGW